MSRHHLLSNRLQVKISYVTNAQMVKHFLNLLLLFSKGYPEINILKDNHFKGNSLFSWAVVRILLAWISLFLRLLLLVFVI
jgi:hypothetical protein